MYVVNFITHLKDLTLCYAKVLGYFLSADQEQICVRESI